MERIKKIGNDGKEHFYWRYTEEELKKLKEKHEAEKKEKENQEIESED